MSQATQIYYTPKIEELFVGYELQARLDEHFNEWIDSKITIKTDLLVLSQHLNMYRTKWLRKGDIISDGFSYLHYTREMFHLFFRKLDNNTEWRIGYKQEDCGGNWLEIQVYYKSSDEIGIIYSGLCPSINEFRKICGLLKI